MRAVGLSAVLALFGAVSVLQPVSGAEPVSAYAPGARVDLRVLVLSDGTTWVDAVRAELLSQGVPVTTINLTAEDRPRITPDLLSDTVGGAPRARFQAVVTPDSNPASLAAGEAEALAAFERAFRIRRVESFVLPSPAVGLTDPAHTGSLDGLTATVTAEARAGAFGYLRGGFRFEDNSPTEHESFGYLATAVPPVGGAGLTPLVTTPIPGSAEQGVLAGVYAADGRERLVLTFAYSDTQRQFRVLAPGLVNWMTRGMRLGYQRAYFSVHIDDTFSFNSRWSMEGNCTPGEGDCAPGVPMTPPIRMTPDDVTALIDWQRSRGLKLDQYFNALGSEEVVVGDGSDPLAEAFLMAKEEFRWGNHTYEHLYLGCERDFSVIPWRCERHPDGRVKWVDKETILHEIQANLDWARAKGVPVDRTQLLSGEHSGMAITPQQPEDNPNFVAALAEKGITVIGADASRDFEPRVVGPARTISRYPISLYFNVGTKEELVDEYNWIYTTRADGGSGMCEDFPETNTCVKPLRLSDGFETYIIPVEVDIAMRHILNNDPRPHYLHQANLAERRLAYPLLDAILAEYRATFTDSTPLINQSMTESADVQGRHRTWQALSASGKVTAYVKDNTVTVAAPGGSRVPITMPSGTRTVSVLGVIGGVFGESYAGLQSTWQDFGRLSSTQLLRIPGQGVRSAG